MLLTDDQDLNYGASTRTGALSMRSESFEFTPTSNINADYTPSSVNYSADDHVHGPNLSTNVKSAQTNTAISAGACAGADADAKSHKFGSLTDGLRGSTPLPGHGHLSGERGADSPLYVHHNGNAFQAHTRGNCCLSNMPVDSTISVQAQSIDLSFVNLFAGSKQEILKLLRDDKFPRFKLTQEFQQFIHAIKPYGSSATAGEMSIPEIK